MRHDLLRPQDVNSAIGFGQQPVSIFAGLAQQELKLLAKEPEPDAEGSACLYE
jgi:hypothetical protein